MTVKWLIEFDEFPFGNTRMSCTTIDRCQFYTAVTPTMDTVFYVITMGDASHGWMEWLGHCRSKVFEKINSVLYSIISDKYF